MKLGEEKDGHDSCHSDTRESIDVSNGAYHGPALNTIENLPSVFGSSKNTRVIEIILKNENYNILPKVPKIENKQRGSES